MKLFKPMSDIFITGDVWLGEGKIVPGSVEKTNNGIECDYLDCSSVPPKFPDAIMSDGAYWPRLCEKTQKSGIVPRVTGGVE